MDTNGIWIVDSCLVFLMLQHSLRFTNIFSWEKKGKFNYPCSQFCADIRFDIKLGDSFHVNHTINNGSKFRSYGMYSLTKVWYQICYQIWCQIWYQHKTDYMDRASDLLSPPGALTFLSWSNAHNCIVIRLSACGSLACLHACLIGTKYLCKELNFIIIITFN